MALLVKEFQCLVSSGGIAPHQHQFGVQPDGIKIPQNQGTHLLAEMNAREIFLFLLSASVRDREFEGRSATSLVPSSRKWLSMYATAVLTHRYRSELGAQLQLQMKTLLAVALALSG